jgi:hypothetical protein
MLLDQSEFLIHFVPEHFAEQAHVVVLPRESLDPLNNSTCPLYNELLESVSLIEVGVHVLLHGLLGYFVECILLVMLLLVSIYILDEFLHLFKRQVLHLGGSLQQHLAPLLDVKLKASSIFSLSSC